MTDEGILPREENTKRDSWETTISQVSSDSNNEIYQSIPAFQLQLIQKRVFKSKRPLIESTKFERLSFYNTYTTPVWRTETMSNQFVNYNSSIWLHIGNRIFKSLSHTFVHIFLAAYSPEEHIFLTKMVPFCIGHKFLVIAASLFELLASMTTLYLTFYYFVNGLLYKNPWNRCSSKTIFDEVLNTTIHCYELEEFSHKFKNGSNLPYRRLYMNDKKELFALAQVEYLRLNVNFNNNYNSYMPCIFFLWGLASLLTPYASKKPFWKVLNCVHWSIIFINIITIVYIILDQHGMKHKTDVGLESYNVSHNDYLFLLSDVNIVEGITTSPPVAHILSSRSTQPIHPSEDSSAIVISNAAFYIFKLYLSARMTKYCKYVIGAPMYELEDPVHSFFLVWPIFLSYFYLGNLYSLIFLGLNSIASILTITIVFRCFIEMIIYEWNHIKPWMVIIAVFLTTVLVTIYIKTEFQVILHIYTKGFATLSEIIFLYMFYPIGRLIDDYTFYYGEPPTQLRKLSLQVIPFYYVIKFFGFMYSMYDKRNSIHIQVSQYLWSWYLTLVPLVLGMIFAVFRQIFIRKAGIYEIFKPEPTWGPKDCYIRQLRMEYDSRVYVKSDVPRSLSRYLLSQAEPKVYKLDVRYDINKKSKDELYKKYIFKLRDEKIMRKIK